MEKNMPDLNEMVPDSFVNEVKDSGELWGLQFEDEWVVCDSQDDDTTDVMPLWSSEKAARLLCCDEWQEYVPAAIPLDEFFDEWVNDLHADNVLIGVNWDENLSGIELDAMSFAQSLADFS